MYGGLEGKKEKIDLNFEGPDGFTPLWYIATYFPDTGLAEFIIKNGARNFKEKVDVNSGTIFTHIFEN